MSPPDLSRLHALRAENTVAGQAMREQADRFARLADRKANGTAPRAVVAFQLFQTPPELAKRLVALLRLTPDARVLEPSAGLGRILDCFPSGCEAVAVEQAAACAGELFRQERDRVRIMQRDFLTVTPEETGLFDAVAMNPPFHMRADVAHILHAATFLKPGARLAALCLDTPRREELLRDRCDSWEKIPAGTFAKEGTRVACILLTLTP